MGPLCRCLVRAEGPVLDPMLSWGGCVLEGDMPTGEPRVPPRIARRWSLKVDAETSPGPRSAGPASVLTCS